MPLFFPDITLWSNSRASRFSRSALLPYAVLIKSKNYQVRQLRIPNFSEPDMNSSLPIRLIGGFLFFWYDFIIGDDWRVAAVVITGLYSAHILGANSWWLMPTLVASVLTFTLLEASAAAPSDTSR